MSEVIDRIKSRGYWSIVIRPTSFVENRLPTLESALALVQRCAVSIEKRGWPFPQIELERNLIRGDKDEWVGQEMDWHIHVETWRMYKSAQFVYLGGFWSDWKDQSLWPGPAQGWASESQWLYVGEVIIKLWEAHRFAAGMAVALPEFESFSIDAKLVGLKDRVLRLGMFGRGELDERILISNMLLHKETLSGERIIGGSDEIALSAAAAIFQQVGWDPGLELLRAIREELLR